MAQLLKCSRGHSWSAEADSTLLLESRILCPHCGQLAVSRDSDISLLCQTLEVSEPDSARARIAGHSDATIKPLESAPSGNPSDQTQLLPDAALPRIASYSDATINLPESAPSRNPSDQTQVLPDSMTSFPGAEHLNARTGEWTLADPECQQGEPATSPKQKSADAHTQFDQGPCPDEASSATLVVAENKVSADASCLTVDPNTSLAAEEASSATMDVGESRLVPDPVQIGHAKTRTADAAPGLAPSSHPQVAGYEILKELGRGAMGVVYKARQVALNRLVALKMVLAGQHAGPRVLARFQIEAEAVARIHHPNIVQIYEIGDQAGCPFFSLEYVDGGTLDQRIAGKFGVPREVARVVQQLAEAMDSAHRCGVIHRDLKPANILLAFPLDKPASGSPAGLSGGVSSKEEDRSLANCIPKVTDFGLAKRLESDSGQTQAGSIMGTPSYMAPEQAEGKADEVGPPADIYALGAILYDLLTGRPPFQGRTVLDTLQQVKKLEPTPPRKLLPRLPHDLDTICLKCLEKNPSKRYASAGDLALDLQRFLKGEPIRARPVPVWERGWKWCRRRPAAAGLAGLSVLFALALMVGGPILAHREAGLRGEAELQRKLAEEQRALAEADFRGAKQVVDAMVNRIGSNPLEYDSRMERVRRDMLADVKQFYKDYLKRRQDNPELRELIGGTALRVGEIHILLGELDRAEKAFSEAQRTLEALTEQFGERLDYRVELARAYYRQGDLLEPRDPLRAEAEYRKAIAVLQDVVEKQTLEAESVRVLSSSYRGLGVTLLSLGKRKQAEEALTRALALKERLADAHQDRPEYRHELGKNYNDLGLLHQSNQSLADSERAFDHAAELLDKLHKEHPRNADYQQELVRALTNRATVLQLLGKAGEAEPLFRQALLGREELVKQDPDIPAYQYEKARTLASLATLLQSTHPARPEQLPARLEEAEQRHREALDLFRKLTLDHPFEPDYQEGLVGSLNNLADLLAATNRGKEGVALRQEGLGLIEALARKYRTRLVYAEQHARQLLNLGILLGRLNQRKEAQEHLRKAAALFERLGQDHKQEPAHRINQAASLGELAIVQYGSNQKEKAEATFRQAITVLQQLDKEHPNRPEIWMEEIVQQTNLADLLRVLSKADERQKCLKRIEELRAKAEKK